MPKKPFLKMIRDFLTGNSTVDLNNPVPLVPLVKEEVVVINGTREVIAPLRGGEYTYNDDFLPVHKFLPQRASIAEVMTAARGDSKDADAPWRGFYGQLVGPVLAFTDLTTKVSQPNSLHLYNLPHPDIMATEKADREAHRAREMARASNRRALQIATQVQINRGLACALK
jgi:hypothetical protein